MRLCDCFLCTMGATCEGHIGLQPRPLTRSFTCVLLRCHFSLGCEGVNTDTSLPSSSKMLELSCLMTWGQRGQGRLRPELPLRE